MNGVCRGFQVDPGGGRECQPQLAATLDIDVATKLRQEGAEAAVLSVAPDRVDDLVSRYESKTVRHEEYKEQAALSAGQLGVDPATRHLRDEPAAELDACPLQRCANITSTRWPYNETTLEETMAKQITCECGFVASAETEDEVIERIDGHMADDHPDLVGKVSRDDLLGWIEET